MVQIFVKVNGSKATTMEVTLTDDKVEDVLRRIQKDEDVYVTMHGRVLKRSERLKSCAIQVTDRLRGGGRHKDKRSRAETRRGMDASGQTDQQVGLSVDKCQEMTQAQKDVVIQPLEADETYQRMITMIFEAEDEEWGMRWAIEAREKKKRRRARATAARRAKAKAAGRTRAKHRTGTRQERKASAFRRGRRNKGDVGGEHRRARGDG